MRRGASDAGAEEIVQEVMLTVWRKAESYDPSRASVSAWMFAIARNRWIDRIRREARFEPSPPDLDETADTETPDNVERLALSQETAALRSALRSLPAQQREMIEHAFLGEKSHQDIALLCGLPIGTVKSRIRLGLERLRHAMRGTR